VGPSSPASSCADVPQVLWPSGEELEQNEVGGLRDRYNDPIDRRGLGAVEDSTLPRTASHDHIDRGAVARTQPNDAGQRIGGVATANRDVDASGTERAPVISFEASRVDGQEIQVPSRAWDAVNGQGGGSHERERSSVRAQAVDRLGERGHPMRAVRQAEGRRPD